MKTLNLKDEVRIGTLSNYSVNPQVHEKQFDEFTALIANLCGITRACITLIDKEKLWFKSNVGMPYNHVPFKKSYCQFTAINGEFTQFSNTETDPRLADCNWTVEYPHIQFYAGVPLVTADGIIGTLCIMDEKPHVMTAHQKEMLLSLGRMVSSLMESRRNKDMVKNEVPKKTVSHPTLSLRSARLTSRSW